jgi:hypothetical protein
MTALASSHGADRLGDAQALTLGYFAAFLGAAAIAAAAAQLAVVLIRMPRATTTAAAGEPVAA